MCCAPEMHFSAIESELSFTPPESIGVILYTQGFHGHHAGAVMGVTDDSRPCMTVVDQNCPAH
jgi:hypothetical protein